MKKLSLIVYLQNDLKLAGVISHWQKERKLKDPEEHADVLLLSNNVILIDQMSAHEIFVQLCSGLVQEASPYLVVPIDPDVAVAVGKFPKEVQAILLQYGIALTTS